MKTLLTFFLLLAIPPWQLTAQLAEIPFELKNDVIFVDVAVNDNDQTHTFIFDTGASIDVLDTRVAQTLGLEANYQQEVSGAGGATTYDLILSQKLRLQETVEIKGTHLLLTDLERLRTKIEKDFDGILGYSFLNGFVTRIDYENKMIQRFARIADVNTTGYSKVDFQFYNETPIPQFDISITLTNGRQYGGRIFFDSGAAYSLVVNTPFSEEHKLAQQAKRRLVVESDNLNSKSVSDQIAVRSINLAGFELEDLPVFLARDREGVSSYPGYLGLLGAKVISRFDIILDYTTSTLYLKPNRHYQKPFEFPLSGITLKKTGEDILISRVQENCPAYEKGVRKGDRLLSIDGNALGDIDQYREQLKEQGKTCELVLLGSEGTYKTVRIKLERLL